MPTTPLPRTASYHPRIIWGTGTGVDTSAYDDVDAYTPGLSVDGVGRDQDRSYSPPKAAALGLTLTNHRGRFSPGGPLALFLGRGPAVTLDAGYGTDALTNATDVLVDDPRGLVDGAATVRLFTGTAVEMPQRIDLGEQTVAVTAIGTMQALITTKPTTILYESIRTDQAVTVLLDAAGWPAADRVIDTGQTTMLYWFLNGQTTAMDALSAILAAEGAGAAGYEQAGVFHFESRRFRDNNARSLTPRWAFFDSYTASNALVDATDVLVDATDVFADGTVSNALLYVTPTDYSSNPDEVVVSVAATINTRLPTDVQQVWEYGSDFTLQSSEVLDIQVTASEPFKDAVTPRDGTDYTITSGLPLVGVALLTTSGQTVTLRLTAPVGGCVVAGVVSNGIRVRATSLPVTSQQTVTSTVNTALSSARQGSPNDPLVLGAWPELEANQTLDLVNSMALRYQRERRQITFRVTNMDGIHQYAIFDLRISDRIQFMHTGAQLNMNMWVEQLHYAIGAGGLVTLTVGCEQVFDLTGDKFDVGVFDTAVFGV